MDAETLKALQTVFGGLSAEDRAKLMAGVAAAEEKQHPSVIAAAAYAEAIKVSSPMTKDQAAALGDAVDKLAAVQGALSTTQITQIIRGVLGHLAA